MKKLKLTSLLILLSILIISGCSGLTDPGAVATSVTTPVPTSPANNTTGIYPAPAFAWTGSADKLQVSADPNFANIVFSITVTGNQGYCMDGGILERGHLYFWRVGKNYGNNVSWSNAYSFTIKP